MKKISQLLTFLISFNCLASDSIFNSANNDYSNQNYKQAIEKYELIVTNNLESSELYYNLANSYFKTNKTHLAIYYYEKALKIDPNFLDAIENLEICNSQITDKIEKIPELFFISIFNDFQKILSLKNWIVLTVVLIWLAILIFVFNLFREKKNNFPLLLTIISFCFFLLCVSINNKDKTNKFAIIFSPKVEVMSAPSKQSTELFNLHIGTKVKISDSINNWINIVLENGKKGWILKENIKEI
tara:strand:+ start:1382 stop:2110 length:729 start_codon:yes stop_codon:yes gene_type:complete